MKSLAAKDLPASRAFYDKLGFSEAGGNGKNWLSCGTERPRSAFFQGRFERNVLTFNPGWDDKAQAVVDFTDVREHQSKLKAAGVAFQTDADLNTKRPASFVLADPDGNPVLVDQQV